MWHCLVRLDQMEPRSPSASDATRRSCGKVEYQRFSRSRNIAGWSKSCPVSQQALGYSSFTSKHPTCTTRDRNKCSNSSQPAFMFKHVENRLSNVNQMHSAHRLGCRSVARPSRTALVIYFIKYYYIKSAHANIKLAKGTIKDNKDGWCNNVQQS